MRFVHYSHYGTFKLIRQIFRSLAYSDILTKKLYYDCESNCTYTIWNIQLTYYCWVCVLSIKVVPIMVQGQFSASPTLVLQVYS